MSQPPGGNDPYQHDPYQHDQNAPVPQTPGGYQAAPSFDAAGSVSGVAPARPASVGLAQTLMYAGGAVSLLNAVLVLFADQDALRQRTQETLEAQGQTVDPAILDATVSGFTMGGLVLGVIFAGVWFLLGVMNGRGRGWARIAATVLGVINVASLVFSLLGSSMMPGSMAAGTIATVLSLVSAALAAGIVVLLWRRESRTFFAAAPR